MGKVDSSNNENILVKVDQNNLIYIDPNSVIDKDGNISPRGLQQENLVMYVNLEADIIPRSILVAENDKNTLTSIAKGTLNFMRNQDGGDFTSSWTDTYTEKPRKNEATKEIVDDFENSDSTGQSFGIDSIQISIKGGNSIPQVLISFIDVRGKTLFESAENSPYNAFFHIPWPIFYLTIKGFYGKAIRYRLHLVKFSSRFNDSNGNFEVSTTFVGSTYAYLNDIPLKGMLNCPYMFAIDNTVDKNTNTKTDNTQRRISKSSRGYSILSSVYSEMKQKGLIPQSFPVKTLREVLTIAQSLDKILENQISSQVLDADIFVGLKDYEDRVLKFRESVIAWANGNLSSSYINDNNILYYELKGNNKTDPKWITGQTTNGTLELLIEKYRKELSESTLFTKEILKNNTNTNFTKQNLLSKVTGKVDSYFRVDNRNGQYQVKIDALISDIDSIYNTFTQQKDKMEQVLETEMNKIVLDKTNGFGFEPTIRNIFAVILANAEVYIRLMKETHIKAFDQADTRKKRLQGFTEETKGKDAIYPWPEIKKASEGQKQKVIAYPGESDLVKKLGSDNKVLWPEVDFVENFIEVSTNKSDPNADKETGVNKLNIVFEGDIDENKITKISTVSVLTNTIPYINKSPSSFLYEIWERAYYFTLYDSFNNETLKELVKLEFDNIKESTKEDYDILSLLKEKVNTEQDLRTFLKSYSPFERYPYYQDQLPTIEYIKNVTKSPFSIEQYNVYSGTTKVIDFKNLNSFLLDYKPETYRTSIYPFNSSTYLSYLNKEKFTDDELKFKGNLEVNIADGFICTPIDTRTWVKDGKKKNIFNQKIVVGDSSVHILNTPYFHQQLYSDFSKTGSIEKYVGSAYLLLNSLPFYDLEDEKDFLKTKTDATGGVVVTATKKVRISSLFREVGSTHFLPYHLIVKWGSIYHRYKKYIIDGVDIISGCTSPINGNLFFNSGRTESIYTAYTVNSTGVTYSSSTDVGMHPYYDAIYHQILNDYNHYVIESGDTSFSQNVTANAINPRYRIQSNKLKYWTSFVDNSKYISTDMRYTLLPCDGGSNLIDRTFKLPTVLSAASPLTKDVTINTDTFNKAVQYYFRCVWDDEYINNDYTGKTFPSYNEYHRSYVSGTTRTNDNQYSMVTNYRKIIDLIGTFSPSILEDFEQIFLEFASEKIKDSSQYVRFPNVKYSKFQDLLKELLSVEKKSGDSTNLETLINTIKQRQKEKLMFVSEEILASENLLKFTIANLKEIDPHVFYGFSQILIDDRVNTFTYKEYDVSQSVNTKYITLYVGEDIDGYYEDFFIYFDIELSEENVLLFRPLILIYAGYRKSGGTNTKTAFQDYIKNNIFIKNPVNDVGGSSHRLSLFLNLLTAEFDGLKVEAEAPSIKIVSGYNNKDTKIELYNYFKSFNDKWTAGNSIGQRLLMEEFLFLDKANKDIGDKLYLNIQRLLPLADTKNDDANLYSVISMIIQGTGLDMRAVPAYVNFYGTNFTNKSKITPSKKVAENLFGTFMEVDFQEASPKIIIQLVGPSSKHPEGTNKKYKFADDSFNISNTNNNPLIITTPEVFNTGDLSKSNKVVAFEVSFGDQNQNIFKGVQLDQTSLKNTSESFVVLENLARSESGTGAYNVDIGLFDYYRQASYTCDVTCMGNVMIQPTMYFYLKNIPMFKGSYWITEVNHNIRNNNITTTFKGTRIPYASLPDPKDSFTSSYRVLVDRLKSNVLSKFKNQDANMTKTSYSIKNTDGNIYITDPGEKITGEDFEKNIVQKVGLNDFGVPYNGALNEKYVQLVKYDNGEWLRARVVQMGGPKYAIEDTVELGVISQLKNVDKLPWSEIKNTSDKYDFYSTKFKIIPPLVTAERITSGTTVTTFVNPSNKKNVSLKYELSGTKGSRIAKGPIGTGPKIDGYGVGMSRSLMLKLGANDGDVIYFQIK